MMFWKVWRSVVGKLWLTIIFLVSVVLCILTFLLLQFFENFHEKQSKDQLAELANQVASIMESHENHGLARSIAWEIVEAYSARAVIIKSQDLYWYSPNNQSLPNLRMSVFYEDDKLSNVFQEDSEVARLMDLPNQVDKDILVVGVPMTFVEGQKGAVFLYQSMEIVEHTTHQTKRLILISAAIAIILTTVFAFFLSSRITAPLREMRKAAMEVTRGEFNSKVPVVTHDEIGELGIALNRMGRQLKNNITALNQEKEQLASILSSMADGVITFDDKGNILVTNPPADRFMEAWYFKTGMQQQNELPQELKALFKRVVTIEKEQMTEVSVQGRSWVIVMSPLYNEPYVRGAVAVLRDMTEERRLDKLRKDFIANVSHELRTPVSMLRGYSEAIVDNIAGTEEEKREIAQIIYEESLRMGRLVNELLDLARMEAGHIRLDKQLVDVQEFIERIIRKFHVVVKEQNVKLLLRPLVITEQQMTFDTDRIEQVLTNLIDNALRHSGENGLVTVYVKNTESGLQVDIKDTGSGIQEEDLPFIFERFYKADKARTRGKSGTGLGLAIAKNIIEAHGGKISVHSKLDEGTTFTFFIPKKATK